MTNIPDKIYLQIESDGEITTDGDWTWCAERVNDSDIEFVRVKKDEKENGTA